MKEDNVEGRKYIQTYQGKEEGGQSKMERCMYERYITEAGLKEDNTTNRATRVQK